MRAFNRTIVLSAILAAFYAFSAAEAQQATGTGTVQVNVTDGANGAGSPVEGAQVTIWPLPAGSSDPVSGTTGKDGNSTTNLKPGNYHIMIRAKGKMIHRYIRVAAGTSSNVSNGVDDMQKDFFTMEISAGSDSRLNALVKEANDAAKKCDQAAYDKAKGQLETIRREFAQDVADIDAIVNQESGETGLPADLDKLKEALDSIEGSKQSGTPVDESRVSALKSFQELLNLQKAAKGVLDRVDAAVKKVDPLQKCEPKAAEQPQTTPNDDKQPPKDNKEAPKDSPKASVLPPATNQAAVAAGGIDPCLVGTWRSQSAVIPGLPGQSGGSGIVMSIGADGTEAIDYSGMQAIRDYSGGTNLWAGMAMGQIAASNGSASLKSVGNSALTLTFTPANGAARTNAMSGLGPAGLGYFPTDHSYSCSATTLTFKQGAFVFTFNRQSGTR